jgi:hypothetical protein
MYSIFLQILTNAQYPIHAETTGHVLTKMALTFVNAPKVLWANIARKVNLLNILLPHVNRLVILMIYHTSYKYGANRTYFFNSSLK